MKISEQARKAAAEEMNWPNSQEYSGHHIQLLLNSEREKIIKECAEIVIKLQDGYNVNGTTYNTFELVKQAILAKLKE